MRVVVALAFAKLASMWARTALRDPLRICHLLQSLALVLSLIFSPVSTHSFPKPSETGEEGRAPFPSLPLPWASTAEGQGASTFLAVG